MIIDYLYNKRLKRFEISYVKPTGGKGVLKLEGIQRFKTYIPNPNGEFMGDNGERCSLSYTDDPNKFDIRSFIKELPQEQLEKLNGETYPSLYTFDIENKFVKGEKADATAANGEIISISITNPQLDTIVLGIRNVEVERVKEQFYEYLDESEFVRNLELQKRPDFKYFKFDCEKDLLKYFLESIVAKVPVLAGWNSLKYDWQYIVNRIKNNYPELSVTLSSYTRQVKNKRIKDFKGDEFTLPMPRHTFILDMMDVIKDEKAVMPIKESLRLDYISNETLGIKKVEYDGDLMDLYNTDYEKFIFYNSIDTILVQLINYRFRTLDIFYMHSAFCTERIPDCFSAIALTEALIADELENRNIKIVHIEKEKPERSELVGAYVKQPKPGKYRFISCNDFSALYPSTGRTCNISFENQLIAYATEEQKNQYKDNENIFISVNNHIYDVSNDSCLKSIWDNLSAARYAVKYIPKKIDATVMTDIEHIEKGRTEELHGEYDRDVIKSLKMCGSDAKCGKDLLKITDMESFKRKLSAEMTRLYANEQSKKKLSNSIYGGMSHVSNRWYNIALANDITGEGRNLIHLMEKHLSTFWQDNWYKMKELHEKIGIEVDEKKCKSLLTKDWDPVIYGDTDSLYIEFDTLLKTVVGYDSKTDRELADIVVKINEMFLNEHNRIYIADYFKSRHVKSVHNFELETVAKSGFWLNVKKHYAQILYWKDGKYYDDDNLPIKVKGIEVIQSSTPKLSRSQLKGLIRKLLESDGRYVINELNMEMQKYKKEFYNAEIEDISGSISVNNYDKYIVTDRGQQLMCKKGCPYQVRALGFYNWIINSNRLPEENIYGGKMKFYITDKSNKNYTEFFAYPSKNLPKWSQKYAKINRPAMFQRTVINPFNNILEGIGMPQLFIDGNIQLAMF